MGDWNRTTKEIPIEKIRSEITSAIEMHLEEYELGPILNNYLLCIETYSEKKKKGLFSGGGDKWVITNAIITPDWLIIGGMGEKQSEFGLSVKRSEMQAEDYKESVNNKYLPDNGVNISGVFTGRVGMHGNQRVTVFIPLGEEPISNQFKKYLLA